MTSSGGVPYLGSKISLISKSEIRYEGILSTIDTKDSTDVALSKVRSFGTEDRPTDRPVAPQDEIYEYVIFRRTDIKDTRVCQPPKPHPTLKGGLPNDPAIVQPSAPTTSKTSAESIVSLNVGGTIFQTSPSTMLKYPNSKLASMYNEGQKIKNLNFFLDEDAEYFRIILNFLRKEKIVKFEEENLFDGVRDLVKNLELIELGKELEKRDTFSKVVLEIGSNIGVHCHDCNDYPDYHLIIIDRKYLTRVPESHLAKFFFGEQGSQNPLSNWIFKKGPNRYFICRRSDLTDHVLNFMKMRANSEFNTCGFVGMYGNSSQQIAFSSTDFEKELEFYGINEFYHYDKSSFGRHLMSWTENYDVN